MNDVPGTPQGSDRPAWHAYGPAPGDAGQVEWHPFCEGTVVKLMAEEGVDCPLWEVGMGMMFSDIAEFVEAGGPPDIAADLAHWAADAEAREVPADLDLRAVDLVRRLARAYEDRGVQFVYRP